MTQELRVTEKNVVGAHATSTVFGTFGELLQGVLYENDLDFLVTFPIACYTTATFQPDSDSSAINVYPRYKQKALKLARLMLEHCACPIGGTITLESSLPEGKGLASSSADLVATARAIGGYLGHEPHPALIEALLRKIEPSDGVMYSSIVAFYHRKVQLREQLGSLPSLTIMGIDEGGEVDTVEFNRIPKLFSAAKKQEYERLLAQLARAIQHKDVHAVGQIATQSALMNQRLQPKRTLDAMIAICRNVQGLGVIAAHSGTVLGLLLSPAAPNYRQQLIDARAACEALTGNVSIYHSLCFDDG
jgi:L-threonine kinase